MTKTCKPLLLPHHPLPSTKIADRDLTPLGQIFRDFRDAQKGDPLGIKITVVHQEGTMRAIDAGCVLVSQGPGQKMKSFPAVDALGVPNLLPALEPLLHTNSLLQFIEGISWPELGWQSSSDQWGYNLRQMWTFPHAAILMDNIHGCYIDDIKDLPYLALVMHERPTTNHEAFELASYIDALLEIVTPSAIPDLVEEWPEGVAKGSIPFSRVNPADLLTNAPG
tara:strand:- start:7 stop:675 length:669 start_codon:yes stop_codon:yes gene_type:complete